MNLPFDSEVLIVGVGAVLGALLLLIVAMICRHRLVAHVHVHETQYRFAVRNPEEVDLDCPLLIEIQVPGENGKLVEKPTPKWGPQEDDSGSFSWVHAESFEDKRWRCTVPRMRALDTWVIDCKTDGNTSNLLLCISGYDPKKKEACHYWPTIPKEVLKLPSKLATTGDPSQTTSVLVLVCSIAASLIIFVVGLSFIGPLLAKWTGSSASPSADGPPEDFFGRWDAGILAIMLLVICACFWVIRRRTPPLIQGYLGWDDPTHRSPRKAAEDIRPERAAEPDER